MDPASETLPPLRDDIFLLSGPPLEDGTPTWTLQDPVRNAFFRMGHAEFEILSRWPQATTKKVVKEISSQTTLEIEPADVEALQIFLMTNFLLKPQSPAIRQYLKSRIPKKTAVFSWLLHHYLFVRIPLFHPDRFLEATLPTMRLFFNRYFLYFLVAAGLAGIYLVSRQWDAFLHTFFYFYSFQGLIFFLGAICFAKILHELGHAYTAKLYGLKVPTMGVAFLVLLPMLYTDTSESWKLKNKTARMRVVAAGLGTELGLAVLALLLWGFLEAGPLKSACFILATVTWVGSLLLNLSPFLRFDGYYLLSDLIDTPNLHNRATALAQWHLRKTLLGEKADCPEKLSVRRHRFIIGFAYATWAYRLVVFTGIALLVYHLFFKALGLFLFSVEMAWFIGVPIMRELRTWWRHRRQIGLNRRLFMTLAAITAILFFILIPRPRPYFAPALLKPGTLVSVYPPFAARLAQIRVADRQKVSAGEVLFILDSPELIFKEKVARNEVDFLEKQLRRKIGRVELLEQSTVTQQQLAEALTRQQGLSARKGQLTISAAQNGMLVDLAPNLHPGRWLNEKERLAGIIDPGRVVIEAYVAEQALDGLQPGQAARFYPEAADTAPVDCVLQKIDPASTRTLSEPYLASIFGGELPVEKDAQGELKTQKTIYRLVLAPQAKIPRPKQIQRGTVRIKGRPASLFSRAWLRVQAVFIRESGF
jgi:putative peptide zinc metalloprotease protein